MGTKDELLIIDKPCSVTAFDMHVQVSRDGRKRGIWFFLDDQSAERAKAYEVWIENAVKQACKIIGMDENQTTQFRAWMVLDGELRRLMDGRVHEGALLEWAEAHELLEALEKEMFAVPKPRSKRKAKARR